MDSLQLFTGLLLAVCAIHLIFSTKAIIGRWMEKNQDTFPMLAKGKTKPVFFDWYVFFDPADLLGRQPRLRSGKPRQDKKSTTGQRPRSSGPRPRPQA